MSKYNFDEIVNRRGSACIKWDKVRKELIPMWIADMDFRTPDFIMDAINKRLECPVMGYPRVPKDYFPTIARWVKKIHGWSIDPSWICYAPGIMRGIGLAECALLQKGAKVIIQPPVYNPFHDVSEKNGMEVLRNPLRELHTEDGAISGYEMDFASLERCIDAGGRLLVLANPHNPAGICWSRETLVRLAEITSKRGVIVISDEIHAEMAHKGFTHIPYASVSEAAASNSITFMAPSKTFNIAGIVSSYAIVPNQELRQKFFTFMEANEMDYPPIFPIVATMAAYRKGAQWRREMLRYVEGNIEYVDSFLKRNIPQIKALKPQASFLIWLDCRGLGMSQKKLMLFMKKEAGLYLNDGSVFGPEGDGFVRMNLGCPRSIVEKAMAQLAKAILLQFHHT